MLGKILYVSDNIALVEYKGTSEVNGDLLNLHVVFENGNQKVLGEITEIRENQVEIKFLGEFLNGKFVNGLLRKANLNSKIRAINLEELKELIGIESKENLILGKSALYKDFNVCPRLNDLFANHLCIFGNSGSGKSWGAARIVQNILQNKESLAYNANLIFFDSFGEYKNAFKNINTINSYYNYKLLTRNKETDSDIIQIPVSLLTVDDFGILLQAEKHTQLTILERAMKYAKIFSQNTDASIKYKNNIIAKAILTVLYSNNTAKEKKDEIFRVIDICHTDEFNFDSVIPGLGYTRSFSECFQIDAHGRFGEEVLITEYILNHIDENLDEMKELEDSYFTLEEFADALEFTLISDGFNQNELMHNDAQILKVRLNSLINSDIAKIFTGDKYVEKSKFITELLSVNNKKAQIINISLDGIDDTYAKAIVKIFAHIIFEFAKANSNRATIPFHLFLEEAHRYVQNDNDVFLLGYNIFDRIAKEGRKYGVLLDIISQRPVDMSDTVIAQCSNFLIFKMTHPKDITYISEMLPNISQDVIDKMKVLQPGTCVAFGSAFKIPMICRLDKPNPTPYSSSCDVSSFWNSKTDYANDNNASEMSTTTIEDISTL